MGSNDDCSIEDTFWNLKMIVYWMSFEDIRTNHGKTPRILVQGVMVKSCVVLAQPLVAVIWPFSIQDYLNYLTKTHFFCHTPYLPTYYFILWPIQYKSIYNVICCYPNNTVSIEKLANSLYAGCFSSHSFTELDFRTLQLQLAQPTMSLVLYFSNLFFVNMSFG